MPACPASDTSTVARMALAEASARQLADQFGEIFDGGEVAVSCEEAGGYWTVSLHFATPPNETAVRALVALAAGADAANGLQFERIGSRDWVAASLDALAPVQAGRFRGARRARSRARARQPHRHRDRGGARLRHRPSRHHARLPAGAGPHREAGEAKRHEHPRRRHRQRRARHRRRAGAAPAGAGERHRSARGAGRARECAAQSRGGG